jgi:excisionase family DNA binding protein
MTAPETIEIDEAAQLLCMSASTLRKRAAAGTLPGAKFGKRWVFVRADLIELIRRQARERAATAERAKAAMDRIRGRFREHPSTLVESLRALRYARRDR